MRQKTWRWPEALGGARQYRKLVRQSLGNLRVTEDDTPNVSGVGVIDHFGARKARFESTIGFCTNSGAQIPVPKFRCPNSGAQIPVPKFRCPNSGAQIPVPKFRCPNSGAQIPVPKFRCPNSGAQIPVPKFRCPNSGAQIPVPKFRCPNSGAQIPVTVHLNDGAADDDARAVQRAISKSVRPTRRARG